MTQAPPLKSKQLEEHDSFEKLYERHAEQVLIWAMRYANGRRAWAEDLAHDVFIRALEHQAWLREHDVSRWLYRVTQNAAFDSLRREGTFGGKVQSALRGLMGGTSPETPEQALALRQEVDGAMAALNQLPGQERVVMAMKTLDGLSQREIAQSLSLSEGYVSKLLRRAQDRLRAWGWEVANDTP